MKYANDPKEMRPCERWVTPDEQCGRPATYCAWLGGRLMGFDDDGAWVPVTIWICDYHLGIEKAESAPEGGIDSQ
jgi:hypothetical protein